MISTKDTINTEKDILKLMQQIYKSDKTPEILKMVANNSKNAEFEVSINRVQGITISQYMDAVKYIINKSNGDNSKLIIETTLDVVYRYETNNANVYRVTINGVDRINKLMSNLSLRKNHSIFSILVNNIINQTADENKNIFIIHKVKEYSNIIDINEHDIRFRLSQEDQVPVNKLNDLKVLSEQERNKISYRFKQRVSYIVEGNSEFNIRIDLTNVRQNMFINKLEDSPAIYELELEIVKKTQVQLSTSNIELAYNKLLLEIYRIHQLLQKSTKIITTSSKQEVLSKIKSLLFGKVDNNAKDLPAMQSQSLENQHVASDLTTQYSISDKADGERYFMLIMQKKIFLISNNLEVKEIDGSKYNLEKYDNTILDGEYVYISDTNKFIFLAFDCLMFNGTDLRDEVKLETRLDNLNNVLIGCFNVNTVNKKYSKQGDLTDMLKFYTEQIKSLFSEMNSKLKKDNNVVMGKLFFIPFGSYSAEIYAYSNMVWTLYTKDKSIGCPYILDGLIYTPLNQKYTRNLKEIKHQIYKWKPSNTNSVDFYVKFEKNPDTQQILNVYDNSNGKDLNESLEGRNFEKEGTTLENVSDYRVGDKIYRICNLYVGSTKTGIEQPVLFDKDNNLFLAYLYLQNGEVRDIEGNIIQDSTVVEFAYNNDPTLEHPYRWIPLRTRFDKTESVLKYQRKYGNNEFIANKVWRSIISPFELNDIKMLADIENHDSYMKNVIKARITKEDIVKERSENMYYQLITNLAQPMRNFHNFIKSNMIYTLCYPKMTMKESKNKLNVLEVGIGRGGDLMKFYHSGVGKLVGFDIDYDGIYSATDGVISRYQTMKRKMPNFPKSIFLIADAGTLLDLESQEKSLGTVSDINKQTLKQVFGISNSDTKHDKFDIFNCQFMLHYTFKNDSSWNNFCGNVNKYLNKDGYLLITTTDGKLLNDSFVDDKITHYYTDNGKKKKLFEYKKLYTDTDLKKTGLSIDFFNAMYMIENTYQPEYIIDPDFLINELESKCNMILLDTDSFGNQFNMYRYFFENIADYEANEKTNSYFMKIKEFYNFDNDVNKNSFELTKLNRYFIFQKIK